MNSKLLLGLLLVIIIAVGGFMLLSNKSTNNNPSQNQNTQDANVTPATQTTQAQDANVTAGQNGFEPQTLTVKTGTRVIWTNKSGGPVTVNSDNHPTHLLWPFLNLGEFDNGSSVSVTFDKNGKYTYHNHLNASQTGTVIVE